MRRFFVSIIAAVMLSGCASVPIKVGTETRVEIGRIGYFVKAGVAFTNSRDFLQGLFFGPTKVLTNNMRDSSMFLQISGCGEDRAPPLYPGDRYIISSKGNCIGQYMQLVLTGWRARPDGSLERLGCALANFNVGAYHLPGTVAIYRLGEPGQPCASYWDQG